MFSGSLVAIITPMKSDGSLDFGAWDRLLDLHAESGTSGIVVGGTTGESPTVTEPEQFELLRRARARIGSRVQLIAGLGGSSTAHAIERVRRLAEAPVDGLLIVTPAYNKPTQEGLYQHYAALASAASAPILLYNVPGRTCVDMQPATVARLAKLPGIAGIKEALGTVERIRELCTMLPQEFLVLSGDDATARESVLVGARGVISVTANLFPRAMADTIGAALRGDGALAARLDAPLASLHQALFVEANPIPVKWAAAQLGLIEEGIRLPLTWLSEPYRARVGAALREAQAAGPGGGQSVAQSTGQGAAQNKGARTASALPTAGAA
jgi:4-hydroxy-tetrahydrodipicolinate synthase